MSDYFYLEEEDISKRDYFAAAALTGLLSYWHRHYHYRDEDIPGMAVLIADQMLAELNGKRRRRQKK